MGCYIMKKYKDFAAEDFAANEKFQDWVLKSESENDAFWNQWLEEHPEKQQEVGRARDLVLKIRDGIKPERLSEDDFHKMWDRIAEKKDQSHLRTRIYRLVTRVAAVIVGMAILGYGLLNYYQRDSYEELAMESNSGITLELQDGTVVPLDEYSSGVITVGGGRSLARQNQRELVYEEDADLFEEEIEELVFNTLTIPYGKKFELALSDGTHIYLNAGSSLRYPVRFPRLGPRDVYLDGEGYFTVSSDENRPFTVHTAAMDTRVHGTQFNVSSYPNDHNTFTVLVEGSVSVIEENEHGNSVVTLLQPGQRAIYEGGSIEVEEADVDKYTAWVEGKLLFTDDRFGLILKKLERHFDVEIDNRYVELNSRRFTGTFRNEMLDQILSVFIAHTPFEYHREGNKIIITKTTAAPGDH